MIEHLVAADYLEENKFAESANLLRGYCSSFDVVPTLTREIFNDYLSRATSFSVCVQINPGLQRNIDISRETVIDIVEDGLNIMPVWGYLTEDGCLHIGLTYQWHNHIKQKTYENIKMCK